ncbi:MAG: efflux RND transporter periplasmic adaptor subunit [Bacteroidales bacterium]|nr:efflux RND transporter periplasmic adaptor subunit [Bacteroidales bacterium]MBN2756737.1 efflux RND transporter periplasmic adaptor subunit [Bacteroidales bacterium]
MNKKLLKYLIIAVIVLIVFAFIGKRAGWFGKKEAVKVATELALKRTIIEIITANGKIQPQTEVKISPEVSGEIVQLNVIEGQQVKIGDLLVKINPEIYLSVIDKMEASLNSAKANWANSKARLAQTKSQFKNSELSYNRNKKLWEDKAISDSEYESALSAYEVAKADVEAATESANSAKFTVMSAEASLREAKENLSKTTLYAPMSGTISKLNVELGERVVGTAQMAGTELLRIANLDLMEVQVDVNENDIVRVKKGDTAIIEVDAYLGKKFKGIVTEIANSASIVGGGTDQVTNFEVKILLLKDSYKELIPEGKKNYFPFRPGMSATTDIQTETKYSVLSVPIQAITTRIDSSGKNTVKKEYFEKENDENKNEENAENKKEGKPLVVVFVYEKNKAILKIVETGIQNDNYIEITSGIKDSTEIITAPYSIISKKLINNQDVEKVKKEKLFSTKEK